MANGIWTSRDSDKAQKLVLHKAYFTGSDRQKPEYEEDFNIVGNIDKRRSFLTVEPMAGLGTLEQKREGDGPVYDSPFELIPYTATFATWALGVKCTEEGELEDPENVTGKIPGQLAKSVRFTKDLTFYNVLNLGWNAAVTGADGQPLFSSVHALGPIATPTGVVGLYGTFSNNLGNLALSPEALEQGKILFRTMLDDRGLPDTYTPVKLVVPEQMEKTADEIVGSPQAPFTSDNTKNTQYKVVRRRTVRYITNPNAWFLQAANGDPFSSDDCHKMFVAYKWDNRFKAWRDGETDNYNQKTSFRATYGFAGWRGIVGSQGSAGNS